MWILGTILAFLLMFAVLGGIYYWFFGRERYTPEDDE
jgi:hypothetical protein